MKNTDKITLTVGQLKRLIKESINNESINGRKSFDVIKIGDRGYDYCGHTGEVIKKGTVGEFYDKGLFDYNIEKVGVKKDYPAVLVLLDQFPKLGPTAYIYDEDGILDGFSIYWDELTD